MNNSNVAHAWANQTKQSAKGSNMFFEGDTIYSYGYHFPIAKIMTVDNTTFIAYNCSRYSNSTSKHQGHVKASIAFNMFVVIDCIELSFGYYGHKKNVKYYIDKITTHLNKTKTSKKYKEYELTQAKVSLYKLNEYIRIFKIDTNEIKTTIDEFNIFIEYYENSDEYKNWLNKVDALRQEKEKYRLIEQAENIVKFREFKLNHVYSLPTNLLRFNSDKNEVQTSGGINIAKDTFLAYYDRFIKNDIKIGEKIVHYQFGGTKDNIVFVGCHKFELSEIENLINTIK